MNSLFGYLVNRFSRQPENMATEALFFLLRSPFAREGLNVIFRKILPGFNLEITYKSQETNHDGSRPDIVGYDSDELCVVIETKFWAGFTDSQPNGYLKQLSIKQQGILLFVAPSARIDNLSRELQRIANGVEREEIIDSDLRKWKVGGKHAMALISWRALLNQIRIILEENHKDEDIANLNQLFGLCELQDSDAFLPVKEEELSGDVAKRILQYCHLIDCVMDKLESIKLITKPSSNNVTQGKAYYGRSMYLSNHGCCLYFTAWQWNKFGLTPFWLSIKNSSWETSKKIPLKLAPFEAESPPRLFYDEDENVYYVPIFVLSGAEKHLVVDDMAKQFQHIAGKLAG